MTAHTSAPDHDFDPPTRLQRLFQAVAAVPGVVSSGLSAFVRSPYGSLGQSGVQRSVRLGLIALNLIGAYYLIGMLTTNRIDNDPEFAPAAYTEGGLRAVDTAAALIAREVDDHEWVMNAPWLSPAILLDNMASFQEGLIYGLGRFTTEMVDHLARARGSSRVDPDLDRANGLLRFPGDVWVFDLRRSFAPTVTSEEQYRGARLALLSYNRRVAAGQAIFDPRPDNLRIMLDRIAADLGSQAALLDALIQNGSRSPLDPQIDRLFFSTKGRLYAYYLLLRELEHDFAEVIVQQDLDRVWAQMIDGFREAAGHLPIIVLNGEPGSLFLNSHTAEQGFLVLRANAALLDVAAVLSSTR